MSNCTSTLTWPGRLSSGPLEDITTWLFGVALRAARFGDRVVIGGVTALLVWRERRRQRLTLRTLDDHLLRDIGLSQADVEGECRKAFWQG